MKVRIYNDDGSDYCDYTAETIEEIRELCGERIKLSGWRNGYSEILEENNENN